MPTAILDVDLKNRAGELRLDARFARALVLLRWGGRPVGRLMLPVTGGTIDADRFERALAEWADSTFWSTWLRDSLGWDEAEPTGPLPPATVAVCTRERPDDLLRCLAAVCALPDQGQEVLVVDNRPATGRTLAVVSRFARVRYVRQDDGGLNAARNRALREANHPLVAFTDDDAIVDPGWLAALTRNFEDPRVLCATGLTMPVELETEAQELFEAYTPFSRGFERRVFDPTGTSPLAVGPVGAGANMALRRSIRDRVGEFDEALDGGTPTRSGGDHEMFSRLLASGFHIVYDPAALSWHRHRRTMEELRDTVRGYGTGVYAMWTRALLTGRDYGVFKQAYLWLRHGQLPELRRSLRPATRRVPLGLLAAEWRGCLAGPRAYLVSRRLVAGRRR